MTRLGVGDKDRVKGRRCEWGQAWVSRIELRGERKEPRSVSRGAVRGRCQG